MPPKWGGGDLAPSPPPLKIENGYSIHVFSGTHAYD